MHELSIAQNIIDIVRQSVPEKDIPFIRSITMKVGDMSGVVADSLEFSYGALIANTDLKQSALSIIRIPFVLKCRACGAEHESQFGIALCASCGSADTETISGNELQITEIELEDVKEETS